MTNRDRNLHTHPYSIKCGILFSTVVIRISTEVHPKQLFRLLLLMIIILMLLILWLITLIEKYPATYWIMLSNYNSDDKDDTPLSVITM